MTLADTSQKQALSPAVWINFSQSDHVNPLWDCTAEFFDLINLKDLTSLNEAVTLLRPELIFVTLDHVNDISKEVIELLKTSAGHLKFVFLIGKIQKESISLLLNNFDVLAIHDLRVLAEELKIILKASQKEIQENLLARETLTKFKFQNRQLETLTRDLETLVKDRTQDIETSKNEIEKKVRRVKQLVSFIKSLSSIRKVEDLLVIIREEIRKAYGIGEAFLACDTGGYGPWILYFLRGDIVTIQPPNKWNSGVLLRINEIEDQQYLANTFGRPFGRVIAFPLQVKGSSRDVVLFVEHQLVQKQIDSFIDYMGERLQSLSLALDRSLLEVELKRATYLWESTFDSIDDPIAIMTNARQVIRSNKTFSWMQEQFGESSEMEEIFLLVDRCVSKKTATNQLFKAGQMFYDIHCYPIIFHKDDPVSSVVLHFVDVTNYRSLQSSMIQNEKMSAIGHLAGNIAHELNNPLTGIRSLCQVLLTENSKEDQQVLNDLKEVEAAAARSQKIITNLLTFSQSASESELKIVDLNELVNITLPLLKSITSEHRREFKFSEEPLFIHVDPHLMQQVIFNLINNSCQAMKVAGDLVIKTEKQGALARFSVQDSGPGVPESLGSSIFDPFVTTKSEFGGTGLGLSMSRKVVQQLGGNIGYENLAQGGVKFWFALPLANGEKLENPNH